MQKRIITSVIQGDSIKGNRIADDIISLDSQNMTPILESADLTFPEEKRRAGLFHPSTRVILARCAEELVGYVDYRDDWNRPPDLYLSSIQIERTFQGGHLFKLLISHLINDLRLRKFETLRTHVQISNLKMIAVLKKLGFTLEQNEKSPATLNASADKTILDSPRAVRLFSVR